MVREYTLHDFDSFKFVEVCFMIQDISIHSPLHIHRLCICKFNQPWIKNMREKGKNSRKFQKVKLEFAMWADNYLHSIYILLGIISNLEMI